MSRAVTGANAAPASATMPPMAAPSKTNPHGAGRNPRLGERASTLSLRLTPTERAAYQAAADRDGVTLGEWIRAACDAQLPKRKVRR